MFGNECLLDLSWINQIALAFTKGKSAPDNYRLLPVGITGEGDIIVIDAADAHASLLPCGRYRMLSQDFTAPRAIYREKANLCALGLPPFTSINIKYDAAFLKYEGYILHFMERYR